MLSIPLLHSGSLIRRFVFQIGRRRLATMPISSGQKKKEDKSIYWLAIVPLTTFGLGVWQVYRLKWKTDLIEQIEVNFKLPPLELTSEIVNYDAFHFHDNNTSNNAALKQEDFKKDDWRLIEEKYKWRRAWIQGEFQHEKEILLGPKTMKGMAGYHVITPLKRSSDGLTILVNRGFVPNNLKEQRSRPETLIKGQVTITGILRDGGRPSSFTPDNEPDRGIWFWLDIPEMSKRTSASPILIDALLDQENPKKIPIGGQTTVNLRNNHLSYVFTWFSLSAATAAMLYFRK
jgi:surfeit locus 1 family protein